MIHVLLLALSVTAFAQQTSPCPTPDDLTYQAFIHIQNNKLEDLTKIIKANPQLKDAKTRNCERLYHYAIRARNEEARKILDKHGFGPKKKVDINTDFDDRQSYFDWALMFGSPATYDDLKKRGGEIKYIPEIHFVARSCNNSGLLTHLVSKGVKVNLHEFSYGVPLTQASKNCKFEIAAELLKNGANPISHSEEESPLLIIIRKKVEPSWIEAYLKAGADLKYIYRQEIEDTTALMYAAKEGNYDAVKLLLDYGAEINAESRTDGTALHFAIQSKNDPKIIELLLERGADPNIHDGFYGYTPFLEACKNHPVEILELLANHGADITARTGHRENCLHSAAMGPNSLEAIRWIGKKLGPNFNYKADENALPSSYIHWSESEKIELIRKIETGQSF